MAGWMKKAAAAATLLLQHRLALAESAAGAVPAEQCVAEGCDDSEDFVALQVGGRRFSSGHIAPSHKSGDSGCPMWDKVHAELQEPQVVSSDGPEVSMELHVQAVQGCVVDSKNRVYKFYTRAYGLPDQAATIPGPTVVVRPGQKLTLDVINDLKGPSPGCDQTGTESCYLNTTNLHVHGLHVTAAPGGDNVFDSNHIPPGGKGGMVVTLPENHEPGLSWYHPHFHHSTADQAGGGMAGGILVQDPPGLLPKEVEDMERKVLVVTIMDLYASSRLPAVDNPTMEKDGNGDLWKDESGRYMDLKIMGSLVNGMVLPKITMESGKWYRFEILFAAIEKNLRLSAEGSGTHCDMQLLAKDAVYLKEAPRKVNKIFMAPGNRASVAVRCTCQGRGDCEGTLDSRAAIKAEEWDLLQQRRRERRGLAEDPFSWWAGEEDLSDDAPKLRVDTLDTSIVKLAVKASGTKSPDIKPFSVAKPCYLVDLNGPEVVVKPENKGVISMPMPGPPTRPQWEIVWWSNVTNPQSNYVGQPMTSPMDAVPPLQIFQLGNVAELWFQGPPVDNRNKAYKMGGIMYHPYHLHTTPYQIISIRCQDGREITQGSCPDDDEDWYKIGDWQDTMMDDSGLVKVRFQLEKWVENMVMHCHYLTHEDMGMMGYFKVVGKEGTIWPDAEKVDPTCYRGAFKP